MTMTQHDKNTDLEYIKTLGRTRSDLALEAREALGETEGVELEQERENDTLVTRVRVLTPEGARRIGKPIGTYVTIENASLSSPEALKDGQLSDNVAKELRALLGGDPGEAMVAGLGNRSLTPDSLGPRVTGQILVSRHIRQSMPEYLDERVRSVCAISPGVMGVTGIETGELVRAALRAVRPGCLVVVDSLAAREAHRVLGTVQLTDAGVVPGSGVGNNRVALNRETLGLPVVAIGVPMVVRAATIGRDILEKALALLACEAGRHTPLARLLESHTQEQRLQALVESAAGPELRGFVVTPASIDEAVRNVAALVAEGINRALQPELNTDEIRAMLA